MTNQSLLKQFRTIRDDHVILEMKGMLSQGILVSFVDLIQNILLRNQEENALVKKVFSIFVELYQNILHHSAGDMAAGQSVLSAGVGIIQLRSSTEFYHITSGNLISFNEKSSLENHINRINSMQPHELKEWYKTTLKAGSRARNARLGLIDVARKSGFPVQHQITPYNDQYGFLEISVQLKRNRDE